MHEVTIKSAIYMITSKKSKVYKKYSINVKFIFSPFYLLLLFNVEQIELYF